MMVGKYVTIVISIDRLTTVCVNTIGLKVVRHTYFSDYSITCTEGVNMYL